MGCKPVKAKELYFMLEKDFPVHICDDNWEEIGNLDYITEQYKSRYMGLLTDNSNVIDYVYTAVFPSKEILDKIVSDNKTNALLFLHHPMVWDITKYPVFTNISAEDLQMLKERNISIFNYHAPLDANGEYSTTVNFAKALNIDYTEDFFEYHNVFVGVIGTTLCKTINELHKEFEKAVGHKVVHYDYGKNEIKDGKVALVAGGGNEKDIYPYLKQKGINTYLTGITKYQEGFTPSVQAHNLAKECGVNILSGTHYSTEKFALIKMVEYFNNLGIDGEFIPDTPCLEDM